MRFRLLFSYLLLVFFCYVVMLFVVGVFCDVMLFIAGIFCYVVTLFIAGSFCSAVMILFLFFTVMICYFSCNAVVIYCRHFVML